MTDRCRACHGTGVRGGRHATSHDVATLTPCTTCGGTGEIEREDETCDAP